VKTSQKLIALGIVVVALAGLRLYFLRQSIWAAPARVEPGATVPHMDHSPRHGGLVLMRGDTHFEVVLNADGRCQVYFTDATRADLPASFASKVDIGLATLDGERQNVPFQVDPEGKMWVGRLKMASDRQAIVRVTYVGRGEPPYWIDVPLSAWPN
jgi:hypothetical protein